MLWERSGLASFVTPWWNCSRPNPRRRLLALVGLTSETVAVAIKCRPIRRVVRWDVVSAIGVGFFAVSVRRVGQCGWRGGDSARDDERDDGECGALQCV